MVNIWIDAVGRAIFSEGIVVKTGIALNMRFANSERVDRVAVIFLKKRVGRS